MGDDVEPVQHMEGMPGSLPDGAKIRLPHVAAYEPKSSDPFLAKPLEEGVDGGQRSMLSNPDQAAHADIDLIDQRQVSLAEFPLNLATSGYVAAVSAMTIIGRSEALEAPVTSSE